MKNTTLPAEKQPSKRMQCTGRLRVAVLLMVYGDTEGNILEYDEAARRVGMTTRAMRMALHKQHVRQFIADQRGSLIAGLAATNVAHFAKMRAKAANSMVRLHAAKAIEEMAGSDETFTPQRKPRTGVVIIIGERPNDPGQRPVTIIDGSTTGERAQRLSVETEGQ